MFESRVRPIIIPQYEHTRMAGALAMHWGNAQFDRPAFSFASFVRGVALHDWHYGFGDTLSIDSSREEDWLDVTRRGVALTLPDPVADVVAKLHLKRLLGYGDSPHREPLSAEIERRVAERLPATGHSRADFDWADRITRLCDNLAFYFAFEKPGEWSSAVFSRRSDADETSITYRVLHEGRVRVEPWPFDIPLISGLLIAFRAEGYPDRLEPVVVPYRVSGLESG